MVGSVVVSVLGLACSKSSEEAAAQSMGESGVAVVEAAAPPAPPTAGGPEAGPAPGDSDPASAATTGPSGLPAKHARSVVELAHSTTSADWQVARNILEPKVVAGKASRDEILLLLEICKNQRDGLCEKESKKQLRLVR
jgi:hypothetical protein